MSCTEDSLPCDRQAGYLLLRHASQSSLDESSQKDYSRGSTLDRVPYRNSNHYQKAFCTLNSMRSRGFLCDIILVSDGVSFPVHKAILSSCSAYFHAMFTNFEESKQDTVPLQGIDPQALQILLDYIYTAEVHVTEDNVQTLLPAANLLQLNDVKDACCEFLASQLHPSNCLGIRAFADVHGCVELLNLADKYTEQYFSDVVESEEFFGLSVNQVCRLISSDKLTVPSEEKVFESVIAWVNHEGETRSQHLPTLMEQVRLPLVSQDFLVQRVEEEPLLRSSSQCKDFLIEALKYHLLKTEQKLLYRSPRTRPRFPYGLPKVLVVVGGQSPKAIRNVECYDFTENKWSVLADMPTRRCRAGLTSLNGRVYAVGGFNGSLRVRTVDTYEPALDQWFNAPDMLTRRSTLGVAVLNGCVYAVGGFDGTSGLNTAEKYDPAVGEWRMIANMFTRRSSVGVAVLHGILYAVGGYDGQSRMCLASVETYNPEANTWSPAPDMSAHRSGAGVAILDGQLYAVGGHDGPLVRKSVERFNPLTQKWTPVADMCLCRRNAGVIAHDGLLYVVGGDDGSSNLSSVEVYDPALDTWTLLTAHMANGRSYAGVVVINKPL
ncbi:hypothetical protein QYM36_000814 [Artemia franciscana]|uniref:Kelch-like protein diablo n=2 Tax=Artemia franciscana TaxID=6661 RepID=A0AA88IMG8_ARTSF|nr:hypothetical protein QYM36_000814 [Artemia franciscana]